MFCCKCGTWLGVNTQPCPHCGEPVVSTPTTTAAFGSAIPADRVALLRQQRPDLVGIGGWLFLFCLGTAIIAPISLVNAFRFAPPERKLQYVCLAALYCFSGMWVWMRKPTALTVVKVLFIAIVAFGVYNIAQIVLRTNGLDARSPRVELLGFANMQRIIWAGIWYLYFKYSKRVLATFGENL